MNTRFQYRCRVNRNLSTSGDHTHGKRSFSTISLGGSLRPIIDTMLGRTECLRGAIPDILDTCRIGRENLPQRFGQQRRSAVQFVSDESI
jgi:hypothetical protein